MDRHGVSSGRELLGPGKLNPSLLSNIQREDWGEELNG